MSTPMTDRRPGETSPPPEDLSRNNASPLLWLLLVAALLAVGWYFYNRNAGGVADTSNASQPVATSPTGSTARTERESAAAQRKPKASTTKPRVANATKPANRVASPLGRVQPDYPAAAQRRHSEGTVVVRVSVGADGMPTDVGYAERSGDIELDRAALESVREWRFQPALKDGRAIASTVDVPVDFKLLK